MSTTSIRFAFVVGLTIAALITAAYKALKRRQAIDQEDEEERGGIYEISLSG